MVAVAIAPSVTGLGETERTAVAAGKSSSSNRTLVELAVLVIRYASSSKIDIVAVE